MGWGRGHGEGSGNGNAPTRRGSGDHDKDQGGAGERSTIAPKVHKQPRHRRAEHVWSVGIIGEGWGYIKLAECASTIPGSRIGVCSEHFSRRIQEVMSVRWRTTYHIYIYIYVSVIRIPPRHLGHTVTLTAGRRASSYFIYDASSTCLTPGGSRHTGSAER